MKMLKRKFNSIHPQAFLHISTLYSNCDREMIEEKVYESDIAFDKIIQVSGYFLKICAHFNKFYPNGLHPAPA